MRLILIQNIRFNFWFKIAVKLKKFDYFFVCGIFVSIDFKFSKSYSKFAIGFIAIGVLHGFKINGDYKSAHYFHNYYAWFILAAGAIIILNLSMPGRRGLLFGFRNYKIEHIFIMFKAIDARMMLFVLMCFTVSGGTKILELKLLYVLISRQEFQVVCTWFLTSICCTMSFNCFE